MRHTRLSSKCYTITKDIMEPEVGKDTSFKEKWRVFCNIGDFLYIMVRHSHKVIKYSPLYIHRFQFLRSHFLEDAEKFNGICSDPSVLTSTSDKLRYYRYRKGLLQREVAEFVGIERTTYNAYEEDIRDYYSFDILERIGNLFEVDVSELIDDYNIFLHKGQAAQLKELRKSMNLKQKDFADRYAVSVFRIKQWEQGKARMSKRYWMRIFGTTS